MKQSHFWILSASVLISGMMQGMLLPVISIIFEQEGLPSTLNGIHATGMYIGVLFISPFLEKPLIKYGYKNIAVIGIIVVLISLISFPFFSSIFLWFLLRLFIGIGDHMLHFSTQTWLMATTTTSNRGRKLAIYGLFFGLGFAIGPVLTNLMTIHLYAPFYVAAILVCISFLSILILHNEYPVKTEKVESFSSSVKRMKDVIAYAWIALIPPFIYGFVEATLHGTFPVFALRENISITDVAIILPAFAIGGIITQLPIGRLSDSYGRKRVLTTIFFIGMTIFAIGMIGKPSFLWMLFIFLLSGMAVGSTFSLGMSFMADILPSHLLPAGNILCGMVFSIGSMIGPSLGGIYLDVVTDASFFLLPTALIGVTFLIYFISGRVKDNKFHLKMR